MEKNLKQSIYIYTHTHVYMCVCIYAYLNYFSVPLKHCKSTVLKKIKQP